MDKTRKHYLVISITCLCLAVFLFLFIGCASSPAYLAKLGKCRLIAVQDYRFNNHPKRIVIGHTALGGHAQTELFRNGKWIPVNNWLEMDHVLNTYYDLDSALKSGWLIKRVVNP